MALDRVDRGRRIDINGKVDMGPLAVETRRVVVVGVAVRVVRVAVWIRRRGLVIGSPPAMMVVPADAAIPVPI